MTKHQAVHLPIELHLDKTYDVSNSLNVLAALYAEQIETRSARKLLPYEEVKAHVVLHDPEQDDSCFDVQHLSHQRPWKHLSCAYYPADFVFHGMSAEFLKSKLRSFGPDWFCLPVSIWPNSNPEPTEEKNLEIRMVSATVMITPTNFPLFTCYSYKRLSRIVAYCIRYARNTKERSRTQRTAALSATYLDSLDDKETVDCQDTVEPYTLNKKPVTDLRSSTSDAQSASTYPSSDLLPGFF